METIDQEEEKSPNKRHKPDPQTPNKGKTPMYDYDNEYALLSDETAHKSCCGICFSEEGKSVRGMIDSCEHYFCFLCIIEWSKVESRCPLCRVRFGSIRRVRKDGSFIGSGSVRVPVRDQLYDPYGDPVDPYARSKCTVCDSSKEESLLLLCDLCDSASHTFCVGLGATVPEGDWFCRDCALLRAEAEEHENELEGDGDTMITSENASPITSDHVDGAPSTSGQVSIFDIVRDPKDKRESGVDRLLKLVSPNQKFSNSSSPNQVTVSSVGNVKRPNETHVLGTQTGSSVRTLQNCRNVHRHISVLRENWDALRRGSLRFSSDLRDCSSKGSQKVNLPAASAGRSSRQKSSSDVRSLPPKVEDTSCSDIINKKYNVDRAWKLLNAAKSMQQTNKPNSASKTTPVKELCHQAVSITSKCKRLTVNGSPVQRLGKNHSSSSPSYAASPSNSKYHNSHVSTLNSSRKVPMQAKVGVYHDRVNLAPLREPGRVLCTDFLDGRSCSTSLHGPVSDDVGCASTVLQSKKMSMSCEEQVRNRKILIAKSPPQHSPKARQGKADLSSHQHMSIALPKVSDESNGSACPASQQGALACTQNTSCDNLPSKALPGRRKGIEARISFGDGKDDEARDEIISLVKLNLKLLTKDRRLRVEVFKEIARLSTHTILAACGFEHRKIARSPPTLVCSHGDQIQQFQRSTLMPSSCRECFYVFVKDVVNSILSEKLNTAAVSC